MPLPVQQQSYKYCVVPSCTSTTISTPEKLFLQVPKKVNLRKQWFKVMRRVEMSPKATVYCCGDHFDIEKDLRNYMRYKLMGGSKYLRPGVVPHKFDCQKEKKPEIVRTAYEKRRRIEYYERLLDPNNIPTPAFPDVEFVQIENKDAEKSNETPKTNEVEEESEKEMSTQRCSTCLSSDRTIRTIPTLQLRKTYFAVLKRTDSRRVRLCWECEALLERVNNFKKRALLARDTLTSALSQPNVQVSTLSSLCTKTKLDFDLTCTHEPTPRKNRSVSLTTVKVKDENDPLTDYNDAPSPEADPYDDMKIDMDIKLESDVGVSEDFNSGGASNSGPVLVEVKDESVVEDVQDKLESSSRSETEKREKVTLVVGKEGEMYVKVEKDGEVTTESAVTQIYMNSPLMRELRTQKRTDPEFISSQHKCERCIVTFDSGKMLKQHKNILHVPRGRAVACGVCRSYVQPWRMRAHERAHHTLYRCRVCEMYYHSYEETFAHIRQWHTEWKPPGESYHCDICSESFTSAKHRLEHHTSVHEERGQCDECGFISLKSTLWLHIRSVAHLHTLMHVNESSPCNMCHKVFKTPMQLEMHVKLKHSKRVKSLVCEPCDLTFSSLHHYRTHLMLTRRHVTTARVPCPNCKRSFPNKAFMKTHHRLKHFDRSICHICQKKLCSYSAVKKHIRTVHEGIRERKQHHVCEICGISVLNKHQHMQIHSLDWRYACETCGATFRQNASLYRHKQTVHLQLKNKKQTNKKPASEESSDE